MQSANESHCKSSGVSLIRKNDNELSVWAVSPKLLPRFDFCLVVNFQQSEQHFSILIFFHERLKIVLLLPPKADRHPLSGQKHGKPVTHHFHCTDKMVTIEGVKCPSFTLNFWLFEYIIEVFAASC